MLYRQIVLLVDLEMLHDEHAVAHEAALVRSWQDEVLAEHFVRDLLHLVNRVDHVNARFESILAEDALCSGETLHLRLDHELALEVGPELPRDHERLLRRESDRAQRNGNHVLMHQLSGLVLVE